MTSRSRSPTTPRSRAASRSRSGTRMRAGSIVGALVLAALLLVVPDTGLFVMWKVVIPLLPLLFLTAPGPVAQPVPARGLQPDAARAQAHQGADRPELAQGIRLRHRLQPVHRVRRPAQARPRRQRRLLRAAAARRDGRGVHRRHVPEGQERLVQHDLPAAPGPAHLRPDAARCSSPTRTASRASAASRTATTSTRAPPTWPTCTTRTTTGAATASYFVGAFPGLVLGFFAVPGRADGAHHVA